VDSTVVDEDAIHLEVGAFGVLLFKEFDKGVLEGVTSFGVRDDLTTEDGTEARED